MNPSTTPERSQGYGAALMILAALLFSATVLLIGHAHARYGIDGWIAAFYRSAVGLVVAFLLPASAGRLSVGRIFTRRLLFLRGLLGGATIPMFYLALTHLGPGRAGMITGSWPLFAALFAAGLIGEPVRRRYLFWMAVALAGLAGIFSDRGFGVAKPLFDALALSCAGVSGICVVLIRHLRHTESTATIFAAQCVFALLFGLAGAGGRIWIADPWALALVLAASGTVVAGQLSITEAFRHIDVARGSSLQMLTPAFTVAGSALLLGDSFSLPELLGGAAVVFASYRIAVMKSARVRRQPV